MPYKQTIPKAKEQTPNRRFRFQEIYGYYKTPKGDIVNYQIDLENVKEWNYLTYGTDNPTSKEIEEGEEYGYDNANVENGAKVISNPSTYKVKKVYADSDDEQFLNSKGIKTKKMQNSLFVEIEKDSWNKLADITIGY